MDRYIKTDLGEIGLGQGLVEGSYKHCIEPYTSIKCWEILG
jgi:hypothetical protein